MSNPVPTIPDMPEGWEGYRQALLLAEAALCHAGHCALHECGDGDPTLEIDRLLDLVRRELCDEAERDDLKMDFRWPGAKERCTNHWGIDYAAHAEDRDHAKDRVAALEKVLSSILSEGARCRGDQAYRNFCRYAINVSQQALHRGRTGAKA